MRFFWNDAADADNEASASADTHLREVVGQALPKGTDPDTVSIVTACAGLLAGVAYADRDFSAPEAREIERLLGAVEGLGPSGAQVIVRTLEAHRVELASVHGTRFARTLRELGTRELRVHVLDMLVSLAATDNTISPSEQNIMRQLTRALGLDQADYNRAQSEHRDKLGMLR
jgi:uncharacterized tellurite resistance protein B-like protein